MKTAIIVDAGPLVAYYDRDAEHHECPYFTIDRRFDRRPIPVLMPQAS